MRTTCLPSNIERKVWGMRVRRKFRKKMMYEYGRASVRMIGTWLSPQHHAMVFLSLNLSEVLSIQSRCESES